ncbi:uncharacterized protein LOC127843101 [Dreissena polymorpha]|uniref:Uncharacterized protein n=1 Tax=Dreissena polymorpha TaxID=45954 RepID=A0A9D4IR21_DREPO|nr:uncharacterized protein LOC127843101 [Dreissena polymorpha]KAH3785031.1 hypothetical protein DPMN_163114 [Dreissena polymorpha]
MKFLVCVMVLAVLCQAAIAFNNWPVVGGGWGLGGPGYLGDWGYGAGGYPFYGGLGYPHGGFYPYRRWGHPGHYLGKKAYY